MCKTCSKCQEKKLFSNFNKNKSKRDGYNSQCKYCTKEYYRINKEYSLLYQQKYYEANKDRILERVKKLSAI